MHSKNQSFKKEVYSLYKLQVFEKVPKKPWWYGMVLYILGGVYDR